MSVRVALFGLACFAVGAGATWGCAQYSTVRHLLRVTTYNYRGRP